MFIGHFAVAFGLKRLAPRTNLGWLVASVAFLDLLWPIFLAAGMEQVEIDPGNTAFTPLKFISYPYSHSLLMAAVWAAVFAAVYFALTRYRAGALAIALGVVSHWILDAVVHRPDLLLYPGGSTLVGFRLWDSVAATLLVESVMFAVGLTIYLRSTRALDRWGSFGFWAYIGFMLLSYAASSFGPPPPSVTALIYLAPLVWVFVVWGAWADAHRESV